MVPGSDQKSPRAAIGTGEGSGSPLLYEVFLQFRDITSIHASLGKRKDLLVHFRRQGWLTLEADVEHRQMVSQHRLPPVVASQLHLDRNNASCN